MGKAPVLETTSKYMDHAEGEECLKELHWILSNVIGVNYFLVMGTALGTYRDGGFTPKERDIDIAFLQEDLAKAASEIAEELVWRGYEIRVLSRPFTQPRIINAVKGTVKIDMMGMMPWKGKRFCNSVLQEYSLVYPREQFENRELVEVFGLKFQVPSPIETYLENEYGDWRTPREDSVSKTRVGRFVHNQRIPHDFLETQSVDGPPEQNV